MSLIASTPFVRSWLASCMDSFARPTQVTRSSTLPFNKSETHTYFDQTTDWVLGLSHYGDEFKIEAPELDG